MPAFELTAEHFCSLQVQLNHPIQDIYLIDVISQSAIDCISIIY